ncbi:unnamed protein product [Tuber aestivum]|uniref:Uncharacterized protein n=1 Tax=Tuber aestivum TaxID=59557 RepID=A0A292PSW2_9PEZI|nr:unnamed protein product [Tuber aestivum]
MGPSPPFPPDNSVGTDMNSGTYLGELLGSALHISRVLVRVMCKGKLSIRPLDLGLRSVGRDTKSIIMAGTLNGSRKDLRHVCVAVTVMHCTGSKDQFSFCLFFFPLCLPRSTKRRWVAEKKEREWN